MRRIKLGFIAGTFAAIFMAAAVPARAGDREFNEIVSRLAAAYHKKPMPFMGWVSFAARFAQPEGVSGLKLAVFEDLDPSLRPNSGEFDSFMQGIAGVEFHPFVRVHSRSGEETYVYLRDANNASEMLIVNLEPSEAVVVKMRLKPEAMKDWVDDPLNQTKESAHGTVREDN